MAMVTTSRLKAWANNVTKCPICLEVCVDPRSPPCLHAFCFRCISAHCGPDAGPGDEVDCPVCRQRFLVPDGGVSGLQHNFFVEDLISVKDDNDETRICCRGSGDDDAEVARDGCRDGDGASGNVASGYREIETCCSTCREGKDGAHSSIRTLDDKELKRKLGQPADDVHSESRFPPAVLSHVTPPGKPIFAVTSLHNKVYVIRYDSSDIEVYDAAPERTFRLERRRLRVPGLGEIAHGLASCGSNNCLYVSDYWNSSVHRVQLPPAAGNAVAVTTTKWPVARRPAGLSVTTRRNVLVTCSIENKLQEFTTLGQLVREIRLRSEFIKGPFQAVETPNGALVVSQNTSPGHLVLVGADGRVIRSLNRAAEAPPIAEEEEEEEQRQRSKATLLTGHVAGHIGASVVHSASNNGVLKCPKSLAVSKNGFVVVADSGNSRIVCADPSLMSARQLELPDEDEARRRGLREPWAVALDDSRHPSRLYVGTSEDGRLFVFDNVDVSRTHVDR